MPWKPMLMIAESVSLIRLPRPPPLAPTGNFAQKVPSFRGAAEGCEPGTHIPEACVYGFRARRCAAPRNDGIFCDFLCRVPSGEEGCVGSARRSRALPGSPDQVRGG